MARHSLAPAVLGNRRFRSRVPLGRVQGSRPSIDHWLLNLGDRDLRSSTASVGENSGVQTYTSDDLVDPPANSRLVAVARAGRSNHSAAYSWSFTASGGLGAMTVAWTGVEWPTAGNLFARQMAIAYIDVGASPPTGVSVTVDAFGTTDLGNYGLAVLCLTEFDSGSWLAQTPAESYEGPGASSTTPALAAASTGQTVAVAFTEDSALTTHWLGPETGWEYVAHKTINGYYLGSIRQAPTGDASGSTLIEFSSPVNNTAQAVIFEVSTAGGTNVDGSARFVATLSVRSVGSKGAVGSARSATSSTIRSVGTKVGTGASRVVFVAHVRSLGTKGTSGALRVSSAIFARASGSKGQEGTSRLAFSATARALGSKGLTGSVRAIAAAQVQAGGVKGVQGASRLVTTAVVQASGAAATGVVGAARFLVSTTARAVGTKSAQGSTSVVGSVAARAVGTKAATGSARANSAATIRAVGTTVTPVFGAAHLLVSAFLRAIGVKGVREPTLTVEVRDQGHTATVRSSYTLEVRDRGHTTTSQDQG